MPILYLAIPLLATNPGEMHACLYQDTHTRMLMAAPHTVVKTWKQPKYSAAAVATKMPYPCSGILYSQENGYTIAAPKHIDDSHKQN